MLGERYVAFLDFAGGGGEDSATLAVAHEEDRDGQKVFTLDAVSEVRPPFSPEQVCADFAVLLRRYSIATATADRWAGLFPVEHMAKHGVTVRQSAKAKSEIYKEFLPLLNSGSVKLLDSPRLLAQIARARAPRSAWRARLHRSRSRAVTMTWPMPPPGH